MFRIFINLLKPNRILPLSPCCRLYSSSSLTVLSPDRLNLQHTVKQFCDSNVRPISRIMDEEQQMRPEIITDLFDAGLMGIEVSESYGGSGMVFFDTILIVEEIAKADASVSALVDIHVSTQYML